MGLVTRPIATIPECCAVLDELGDVVESMSRRGMLGVAGAAGAVGVAGLVGCSSSAPRSAGDVIRPLERTVERTVWSIDGVADLTPIEIDKPRGFSRNVPSVTRSGRLRVTADATASDKSHRQAWLIPGTGDFVDGEVRTVWWPPSVMARDVVAPQMGLVLRLTRTGGVVADQNIMENAFASTIVAPWSWADGGVARRSQRGDTNTALTIAPDRAPQVRAVSRVAGPPDLNVYLVDRTYEFASGDHFEVSLCLDPTFNGSFVASEVYPNANATFPRPAILATDPGSHTPVDPMPTIGRVSRPAVENGIEPASIYPFHVALRIVGSVVTAKRWRVGDVEPTWDDPSWALTIDTERDSVQPPARGGVGVMTNHMHSGAWVEFDDVEIIRY